jgi:hypothetical protein
MGCVLHLRPSEAGLVEDIDSQLIIGSAQILFADAFLWNVSRAGRTLFP